MLNADVRFFPMHCLTPGGRIDHAVSHVLHYPPAKRGKGWPPHLIFSVYGALARSLFVFVTLFPRQKVAGSADVRGSSSERKYRMHAVEMPARIIPTNRLVPGLVFTSGESLTTVINITRRRKSLVGFLSFAAGRRLS